MGFPHAYLSKEITLPFTSMRMLFHHDKPGPSTTEFYHFSRIAIMIWGKNWQILIDNRNHANLLKCKTH